MRCILMILCHLNAFLGRAFFKQLFIANRKKTHQNADKETRFCHCISVSIN